MSYYQRIQNAIDFVENNLKGELPLEEVARQAFCSLYHFHRIFHAMVGNSIKEYIRNRRLTYAADELVNSDKSVLEIALDYRYGAPESFSRAFKKMYEATPFEYRKKRKFSPLHFKADLLQINFDRINGGFKMEPKIIERQAFKVIGIEIKTNHLSCQSQVTQEWQSDARRTLLKKVNNIKEKDVFYGICSGFGNTCTCAGGEGAGSSDFSYFCCTEVTNLENIPEGLTGKEIKGGKYAVFAVKGGLQAIKKTTRYVFNSWLPNTSFELADLPDLEKYGKNWNNDENSEMELWIPLK